MQLIETWDSGPDVVQAAIVIVDLIPLDAVTLNPGQRAAVQVLIDSNMAFRRGNAFTHRVRAWRAAGVVSHARRSYSGQPLRHVPALA